MSYKNWFLIGLSLLGKERCVKRIIENFPLRALQTVRDPVGGFRLIVIKDDGGDKTIGFQGTLWLDFANLLEGRRGFVRNTFLLVYFI